MARCCVHICLRANSLACDQLSIAIVDIMVELRLRRCRWRRTAHDWSLCVNQRGRRSATTCSRVSVRTRLPLPPIAPLPRARNMLPRRALLAFLRAHAHSRRKHDAYAATPVAALIIWRHAHARKICARIAYITRRWRRASTRHGAANSLPYVYAFL